MLTDWRKQLGLPQLPVMAVELSAYCNEHDSSTYLTWCDQTKSALGNTTDAFLPAMRLAQAAAEHSLDGVRVVSAQDLGSIHPCEGSIHSDKKAALGDRLATATRAALDADCGAVWAGPTATGASMTADGGATVSFSVPAGGGVLHIDAGASCPSSVLPVYCTGGGFELQVGGAWVPAMAAASTASTVTVKPFAATRDSAPATRVRYAFADWPVSILRNTVGGLPARIFDLPTSSVPCSILGAAGNPCVAARTTAPRRTTATGTE